MRIFVSGPLTATNYVEQSDNVERAMDVAAELMQRGHQPFIPHLCQFWDDYLRDVDHGLPSYEFTYEWWMEYCLTWLDQCQALYFIGPSPGSLREHERALHLNRIRTEGFPIFYQLSEVPTIDD